MRDNKYAKKYKVQKKFYRNAKTSVDALSQKSCALLGTVENL